MQFYIGVSYKVVEYIHLIKHFKTPNTHSFPLYHFHYKSEKNNLKIPYIPLLVLSAMKTECTN